MNVHKSTRPIMKHLLRPLVHRTFSTGTVQQIRFRWWYISKYVPRTATSHLVKRTPQVCVFGAAPNGSSLEKQLQSVNLFAPTKMCRVMSKYGSDKGRHNYTPLYSALFSRRYEQSLRVLELGLGTNNPGAPSNMGVFGAPGASLRGWRELFPHALVYGADIDRAILFQEDRIKTFYCDQLDRACIRELWSLPDFQGGMDIIVEDGLHTFDANVSFLEESLKHLHPNGIYVTEDIEWETIPDWCERLEKVYSKQYPDFEFALVIPETGKDESLLFVRRSADQLLASSHGLSTIEELS